MRALVLALVLAGAGCAREAAPPEAPLLPWPHTFGAPGAQASPWWTPAPAPWPPLPPSQAIQGGEACLAELSRLGVAFRPLAELRGVDTPIRIDGPIGGVRLEAGAGLEPRCDCRLAVALAWAAPRLTALGIDAVTFSGAYVLRTQRSGRPSLHARGLAIDVHAFHAGPVVSRVKTDFERGIGPAGCAPNAPLPNRAACALRETGLFKELLTPDSNADHHDHLHLAIADLAQGANANAPRPAPSTKKARRAGRTALRSTRSGGSSGSAYGWQRPRSHRGDGAGGAIVDAFGVRGHGR